MSEPVSDRTEHRRRLYRRLFVSLLLVTVGGCSLIGIGIYRAGDPTRQITISPETTIDTEPLTADGLLDVIALIDQRNSAGVTAENNAAVLLVQLLDNPETVVQICAELGIDVPIDGPGGFQHPDEAAVEAAFGPPSTFYVPYYDTTWELQHRPWTAEEFPLIARTIDGNSEWLDVWEQASWRPEIFVSYNRLMGRVLGFRDAAEWLAIRGMLHVGEGHLDAAWNDCLTLLRLSDLLCRSGDDIDWLAAISLEARAAFVVAEISASDALTVEQLRTSRGQLASLPHVPRYGAVVKRSAHLHCVSAVQELAIEGSNTDVYPDWFVRSVSYDQTRTRLQNAAVDWDRVLVIVHAWIDQEIAALGEQDTAQRAKMFARLEAEVDGWKARSTDPTGEFLSGLLGSREAISHMMAAEILSVSSTRKLRDSESASLARRRLSDIALALATYRLKHGEYPNDLSELASDVGESQLLDPFTDRPFRYERRSQTQCVVYSIGVNRIDEYGAGAFGPDDIAVWLGIPPNDRSHK